jgi:glycosyltransferase involved in cell wall biosynthesis
MLRIGVIMYQTSSTKGQELVAQRMVKEFRRQGYEAFLITSIFHDWEPAIPMDLVVKRGGHVQLYDETLGIPVIRVSRDKTEWPPRRIALRDFVSVLTQLVGELKLNVLITHSTLWNGPEEVAKFVDWGRRLVDEGSPQAPLLFCHMSHFQEPTDERYTIDERSYRQTWNAVSLPQVIREADQVLVVTPEERRLMVKLGAAEDKCYLFPCGIEDEVLDRPVSREGFRPKYGLPKKAKIIAHLGTIEERKNLLQLLEVAKLLSQRDDIHFALAGRTEGEYGKSVQEAASRLPNVSLLGPIPEEDKAVFIRESYLNISLSRSEALGLAQLEFMYAGVPVITSGVGGQSWLIRDGRNGVLLKGPDDVEGAAEAISELVKNRSRRDSLGSRAQEFGSQFSIETLVHQLSKKLMSLMMNIADERKVRLEMKSEEKLLEARVSGGTRVVATTTRLVISSEKEGKNSTSIPYDDITKIRTYARAAWGTLAVGLGATLALTAARLGGIPIDSILGLSIQRFAGEYGLHLSAPFFFSVLPFVPLFASTLIFLLRINRGYLVLYGVSKKLFLPAAFARALRLAERFTTRSLFAENNDARRTLPGSNGAS